LTPADEARFIQLWQEGASYKALAKALGCPLGTVGSRAQALVRQNRITPRPRGGAYATQRAKARPEDPPHPPRPPYPLRLSGKRSSSGPCGCRRP
jgi:hypothetical protein